MTQTLLNLITHYHAADWQMAEAILHLDNPRPYRRIKRRVLKDLLALGYDAEQIKRWILNPFVHRNAINRILNQRTAPQKSVQVVSV